MKPTFYLFFILAMSVTCVHGQPGSLDMTFNQNDVGFAYGDGFVNDLAESGSIASVLSQPDGKVLVGGRFTQYNQHNCNQIIRFNSDGSVDNTFSTGIGFSYLNGLYDMALQPDGKIVVAGSFISAAGTSRKGICRLNSDGSLDTSFDPGVGFEISGSQNAARVEKIALQADGKILTSGIYTHFDGTQVSNLCRLNSDGSLDNTFDTGTGIDNCGPSGWMNAMVPLSNGKILIGGFFQCFNGQPQKYLARLNSDGSIDASFLITDQLSNTVQDIEVQSDDKIVVTGNFMSFDGTPIDHILRLNSDGSLDNTFSATIGGIGVIYQAAIQSDGKIVLGDVRLNSDGSVDASFDTGIGFWPYAVEELVIQSDGKIVVVGPDYYDGIWRGGLMRLNSDGSLNDGFPGGFYEGTGFNGTVNSVRVLPSGKIMVGGEFTKYNGQVARHLVRLNTDGTLDPTFTVPLDFAIQVWDMEIQQDGKIIALANNSANSLYFSGARKIARLNVDGSYDASFLIDGTPNGRDVEIQPDGKFIVVGGFSLVNGVPGYVNVARFHSDGTLDTSFQPNTDASNYSQTNLVKAAVQPDGKILLAGSYVNFSSGNVYLRRLNSDGSLDQSFDLGSGFDGFVAEIEFHDGKILLGGSFTTIHGQTRNGLCKLNLDGSLYLPFTTSGGFDVGGPWDIIVQSDDKILAAGTFESYNGVTANGLARINSDGSIDPTFQVGSGFTSLGGFPLRTISEQADGKIVVGGEFISYDGTGRNRILRLEGDIATSNEEVPTSEHSNDIKVLIGNTVVNVSSSHSLQSICLYDNQGRLIAQQSIDSRNPMSVEFDDTNLSSGLYIISGQGQSQNFATKVNLLK